MKWFVSSKKAHCIIKKTLIIIVFLFNFFAVNGQGIWTPKADIPLARADAFSFSIGNKAYIGGGVYVSHVGLPLTYLSDFWEYDASLNTWTQIANFGGGVRSGGVGFSIGNKGYVGLGCDNNNNKFEDIWEYDPVTNIWTRKADYGGGKTEFPVGFSIGNKGYVGTGSDSNSSYTNSFWEYNPATNIWTQKSNLSGNGRWCAVGFSISNKGYIGTGLDESTGLPLNDFWEYDTTLNSWTQKANFGGLSRWLASSFSINNKGYIGIGIDISVNYLNDFWEYDPSVNQWQQKSNFPGNALAEGQSFSIGNKGYFGVGRSVSLLFKEIWEYDPSGAIGFTQLNNTNIPFSIYPNPFKSQTTIAFSEEQKNTIIKIIDALGEEIKVLKLTGKQLIINTDDIKSGTYFLNVINDYGSSFTRKIVIR
jgi:hypothetical protein